MARLLIRESRTIAKALLVKKNAVVIHPQHGVATAITALRAGETATMFIGEQEISVVLRQAVPFGHNSPSAMCLFMARFINRANQAGGT
ncbi:truncated hydrolase [Salmonella enterica]|nr:truncated hydrolase [Salmonella enterica]